MISSKSASQSSFISVLILVYYLLEIVNICSIFLFLLLFFFLYNHHINEILPREAGTKSVLCTVVFSSIYHSSRQMAVDQLISIC